MPSNKPDFFIFARIRPSWGYAIREGPQSKTRIAIKYPPPTTALGALVFSLLRIAGERREILNSKNILARFRNVFAGVYISVVKTLPFVYGSILRINRYYKDVEFAVTASPNVYLLSNEASEIEVVYLVNIDNFVRLGGTEILPRMEAHMKRADAERMLLRAARGMVRLGSRESVISVTDVITGNVESLVTNSLDTRFSFPYVPSLSVKGDVDLLLLADPQNTDFSSYEQEQKKWFAYPRDTVHISGGPLSVFKITTNTEEIYLLGGVAK